MAFRLIAERTLYELESLPDRFPVLPCDARTSRHGRDGLVQPQPRLDESVDAVRQGSRAHGGEIEQRFDLLVVAIDRRLHEIGSVRVIAVDGPQRHTGAPRHVFGRRLEVVLTEQLDDRVQHGAVVLFPAHAASVRWHDARHQSSSPSPGGTGSFRASRGKRPSSVLP